MSRVRLASFMLFLLACSEKASGQCLKPGIPSGGLPVSQILDQSVTYTDNYKTLGDLTYPSGTVPSCGWPLVIYVHGLGGSRKSAAIPRLAAEGYAVWAYDVRGQGDARTLNPPLVGTHFTYYGAVEKADLVEQIQFVRSQYSGIIHPDRLAVTGKSQGGIHSWFSAAFSGKAFSVSGRGSFQFPVVDCVAPFNFLAEFHDHALRGGTIFSNQIVTSAVNGSANIAFDAPLQAQIQTFFLADDPVGLFSFFSTDPFRMWGNKLAFTDVPIDYAHAYHDGVSSPFASLDRVQSLPATTPWRMHLSTGGHGSPNNFYESEFRDRQRVRWFDHFLWGENNGVDVEAPLIAAVMPLDSADLSDPSHLWSHRFDQSIPAPDLAPERFFLTDNGSLSANPPTATGSPTVIDHQVNPAYTTSVFASSPAQQSTAAVLSNMPLSEKVFASAPLAAERELTDRVRVRLMVMPNASRFHLTALLSARLPNASGATMIAAWGRGVVGATPSVAVPINIELGPAAVVLPAGTVLELTIRNHWMVESPMPKSLIGLPYFSSFQVSIQHGQGQMASFVDVPFRSEVKVALKSRDLEIDIASPQPISLEVDGSVAQGLDTYAILMGVSGHVPGIVTPDGTLPLALDAVTQIGVLLLGSPLAPGFLGNLDANGDGVAHLDLQAMTPLPPSLIGIRLTMATWVLGSNGGVSNPFDAQFR